jgi:hypothetical protein
MENLILDGWEDEEYKAFVDKFKTKKTTDDCYTPENVYAAVADWVAREYGAGRGSFVRPFWPGGDFERFEYPEGCAVVDNPPFSILSRIIAFYARRGIPFFLFAPALTLFSSSSSVTCLPVGVQITYANGAKVPTSFVTNMDDREIRVRTAPELYKAVKAADDANRAETTKALPRYEYPDNIITAAMVQRWCKYGVEYRLKVKDSRPIDALEAQKAKGLTIFGKGYLLSSSAAAERAAAVKWTLSEAEKEMIRLIDAKKVL